MLRQYSPQRFRYQTLRDGVARAVVYFETSHKHYEIFDVPANMLRFKTDAEATDWHIRFSKRAGG